MPALYPLATGWVCLRDVLSLISNVSKKRIQARVLCHSIDLSLYKTVTSTAEITAKHSRHKLLIDIDRAAFFHLFHQELPLSRGNPVVV